MQFIDKVKNGWQSFCNRFRQTPRPENDGSESRLRIVFAWVYKLRSVILAIPVVVGTIILAVQNASRLPEYLTLQLPKLTQSGKLILEAAQISRTLAVWGPIGITAACLVMMFCSRRVVYPWLVSLFSLVLPLFLYVTTIFPG